MKKSNSAYLIAALTTVVVLMVAVMPLQSQEVQEPGTWADYQFLIGEWVNDNPEEQGVGYCSFSLELQDKIMVRRNHAETPATEDRSAAIHDDLMVMYWSEKGGVKANYYDNEGHVINYTATMSVDKDTLRLVSESNPEVPQFRLTYVKSEAGKLGGVFEFAPPGKPGSFSPYLTWTMHHKESREE